MLADIGVEQAAAWLTIVTTVAGTAWMVLRKTNRLIAGFHELESRVGILWGFHMARGHAEAVIKGVAIETPSTEARYREADDARRLILPDRVRAMFEPVAAQLKAMWAVHGHDRQRLEMAVESELRDWLVDNICIPLRVHQGACIALAVEVAREE